MCVLVIVFLTTLISLQATTYSWLMPVIEDKNNPKLYVVINKLCGTGILQEK